MRITQVLCAAGPVDAVTNQALAWRAQFRRWGWDGEDYSASMEPEMRGRLRPLRELEPGAADLVLVHYSGYAADLERVFEGGERTLLLSHNVTPARWFWPHDPVAGVHCRLGREQLHELAARADALAGVSDFNAAELREFTGRDAAVVPVLFDRARLDRPDLRRDGHVAQRACTGEVLFVGRLAPHKRQDLVIQAFAALWRRRPEARLTLIGTPLSPAYESQLRRMADELAPGAVSVETGLPQPELARRYQAADVFLCLSEHEGFCIPLLEAFHFGLPVVARDAAAVGEVVDGAGVLLTSDDDVATVAAVLELMLDDPELRAELRSRGERRLERFDNVRTAQRMRDLVLEVAGAATPRRTH